MKRRALGLDSFARRAAQPMLPVRRLLLALLLVDPGRGWRAKG